MARFLLTLHSVQDSKAGIGVFDTESGLEYLQLEELGAPSAGQQLRGLCCVGQRLFVATCSSLRIYEIQSTPAPDAPWFVLRHEVFRPEWLLGRAGNADLTAVHHSPRRERIFVACNALAAIYEFTLEGEFIVRRHLWEIAPQQFQSPTHAKGRPVFGHVRGFAEQEDGDLFLSVAFRNGSDHGCVLGYDSGEILFDELPSLHSGLFHEQRFYFLDVQDCHLLSKSYLGAELVGRVVCPELCDQGLSGNLRGMVQLDGRIYAGLFSLGRKGKKISPQIVSFDAGSAQQLQRYPLPSLPGFRYPACFFMSGLGLETVLPATPALLCFKDGQRMTSEPPVPVVDEQVEPEEPEEAEAPVAVALPDEEKLVPLPVVDERKAVIELDGVTLSYRRTARFSLLRRARTSYYHRALSDVSLTLYEGEVVGLIGRNGSGKSTMGMLLSGILQPDTGRIERHGRIQLLSLGIGFNNDLTGRDNVFVNAALLGLTRRQVHEHLDEIVAFAELGEFIDEPIRTYSAGMRSRLAFAIATVIQPDVLILDEVLSTGDDSFRHKAENRMREMKGKAKCVVMVSHSAGQIKKLCNRVIWLERGHVLMEGTPKQVMSEYESFCQNPEKWLSRHPQYAERLQA
ncbi:ABC transporter ATP-binding protein [Stutzerimonas balearica]|uniref:ABC transporter ATP-binding protein n=1 Tax=Stutzerimonas balearica TaxID=74829 RepID=UPI0028AACDBB|nr:ABC transporter ATP-binding protein [Stutzerimonas balearica]